MEHTSSSPRSIFIYLLCVQIITLMRIYVRACVWPWAYGRTAEKQRGKLSSRLQIRLGDDLNRDTNENSSVFRGESCFICFLLFEFLINHHKQHPSLMSHASQLSVWIGPIWVETLGLESGLSSPYSVVPLHWHGGGLNKKYFEVWWMLAIFLHLFSNEHTTHTWHLLSNEHTTHTWHLLSNEHTTHTWHLLSNEHTAHTWHLFSNEHTTHTSSVTREPLLNLARVLLYVTADLRIPPHTSAPGYTRAY